MAYLKSGYCGTCDKAFQTYGSNTQECSKCITKKKEMKKKEHFAKLDAMTTEERLRIVEEWIYEHRCASPLDNFTY